MVKLVTQGFHARFDIPKTFSVGKLGKGHAEKLTPTGESFDVLVTSVVFDATTEFSLGKIVHELGEDNSSLMHTNTLSVVLKGCIVTEMMISKFKSIPSKNAYKPLQSSNLTTSNMLFLGHY
jgi:hypothetical protein